MKKIIALLLAALMAISTMAILSACKDKNADSGETSSQSESTSDTDGGTVPTYYTVTEEQWAAAFDSLDEGNFTAAMKDDSYESAVVVTDTLILEKVVQNGELISEQYRTNSNGSTMIYECIDNVWYKFPYVVASWDNGVFDGHIRKWEQEYGWFTEGIIEDVLPIELLDYNSFTYDEEKKAYFCESIEIKYDYGADYMTNFYAYFVNGEFFEITYDFHDNDVYSAPVYSVAFSRDESYRDISLPDEKDVTVLPTDYSKVEGKVYTVGGEFDWQNALVSFQLSNKICYESADTTATILPNKIRVDSPYDPCYYTFEDGTIYSYRFDKDKNDWVKEPADEKEINGEKAEDAWNTLLTGYIMRYTGDETRYFFSEFYYAYGEFEFDAENNEYVLDEYDSEQFNDQFRNIRVKLENGKIVEINFEVTVSFGDGSDFVEWREVTLTPAA